MKTSRCADGDAPDGADDSDNYYLEDDETQHKGRAVKSDFDALRCYWVGEETAKAALSASRRLGGYTGPRAATLVDEGKELNQEYKRSKGR